MIECRGVRANGRRCLVCERKRECSAILPVPYAIGHQLSALQFITEEDNGDIHYFR